MESGRLVVCGQCKLHVFDGSATCPHCGLVVQTEQDMSVRASAGAVLMGLLLTGCDGNLGGDDAVALYGMEVLDQDGDGYFEDEDCDDSDDTIHPEAEETPGDGVDSNCDGEDDT